MTIYGGLEDHEVEAGRLAAWGEMAAGAYEVRMFPGGHFYLDSSRVIFLQTFAGDLLRFRLQIDPRISTTTTLRGGRFDVL
jgi:medium-chain acyl-[acyl-carrier-protein] hydrolase